MRRRFYDIAKAGNAPIASETLRRIGELHAIEAEMSGCSANERHSNRQSRTRHRVDPLHASLDLQLTRVAGRSPIAEAMRYGTSHWQGLERR